MRIPRKRSTHFCHNHALLAYRPRTFGHGIGHGVLAKWFFRRFYMLRTLSFSKHAWGYVSKLKGFGRSFLVIASTRDMYIYRFVHDRSRRTDAPTENTKRQDIDLFREIRRDRRGSWEEKKQSFFISKTINAFCCWWHLFQVLFRKKFLIEAEASYN